jgi:hypothetical protein
MNSVLVLGVCTDYSDNTRNWKNSLIKNNYDFKIIGYGEKWGGWSWRTKQIINALQNIPDNIIIILADVTDVLFIKSSSSLVDFFLKFESHSIPHGEKVIIGAEAACCTGKYSSDINPESRNKIIHLLQKKNQDSRYIFPNGGVLIGRKDILLSLLIDNQNEDDDQIGYLEKYITNDNRIYLDKHAHFIGNINDIGSNHKVMVNDNDADEIDYWDITKNGVTNKEYNTSPFILHFPGKNWKDYNKIGNLFFKDNFINNETYSLRNKVFFTIVLVLAIALIIYIYRRKNGK